MEGKKRGRPLGSGVKNFRILGCRFTEGEYDFIMKNLETLKKKYNKNSEIILYLFNEYKLKLESSKNKKRI